MESFLLSKNKNKNIKKEVLIILQISKETAIKLNKEYGVPYHDNGISRTGELSKNHCKYYLCESKKNMTILKNLQK